MIVSEPVCLCGGGWWRQKHEMPQADLEHPSRENYPDSSLLLHRPPVFLPCLKQPPGEVGKGTGACGCRSRPAGQRAEQKAQVWLQLVIYHDLVNTLLTVCEWRKNGRLQCPSTSSRLCELA